VNPLDNIAFLAIRYSSTPANQQSFFTNPYYFTARRVDLLDNGSLTLQHNRHRYYDCYTGRWTTHDPLGITANSLGVNYFSPIEQYSQGSNIYDYVVNRPLMLLDPWGTATFDSLRDDSYKVGNCGPAWGDFEHGSWNIATATTWRTRAYLTAVKTLARGNVVGGWLSTIPSSVFGVRGARGIGLDDAAEMLDYYLSNKGGYKWISFIEMLRESSEAREDFVISLNQGQAEAERLFDESMEPTPIVQQGHSRRFVRLDMNWQYAMQTYHTWGQGEVERECCCYRMSWTLHLRDNYEFENLHLWGGLVYDDWMYDLNFWGRAKHFRTRGQRTIRVVWPEGHRFDEADDASMLIEGRQPHFKECEGLW
jgi:RHS repeat-associated protein